MGQLVRDQRLLDTYADLEHLADWSDWAPLSASLSCAPREPGVYLFREPDTHVVRFAGMAGERSGTASTDPKASTAGSLPTGLGDGVIGGFTEAALDEALADPDWVAGRLARLKSRGPQRARVWAAAAFARLDPEVSWATCPERADAKYLEDRVLLLLRPAGLWDRGNRRD